ncbi:hypothetical protein [Ramlibacter albus]|uniref:Uncharacterized protein n=1 Tax=Ramlibacter albus TaxID=2079448 RepID=A0A923M9M9_9BURK|nr:hypothetical protein [Ramlibacter albus]MBC5766842.1 hypothetical protein [Ramlibacter albus]
MASRHRDQRVVVVLPLVDELGVVVVSVLPLVEPDVEPDAPMVVPLPVVPEDDAVSVEPVVEPEPVVEAVELVVSLVDGVEGSVLAVDEEDDDGVEVSAAVSCLRSPQAARDMAATMAIAAQRARGVAFIRTLL